MCWPEPSVVFLVVFGVVGASLSGRWLRILLTPIPVSDTDEPDEPARLAA